MIDINTLDNGPATFTVELATTEAQVLIVFAKTRERSGTCYVGTPCINGGYSWGSSRIVFGRTGLSGGQALLTVLRGNWGRKPLSNDVIKAGKRALSSMIVSALASATDVTDVVKELEAPISAGLGLPANLERGEMVEADLEELALLGAPEWVVNTLDLHHLRTNIRTEDIIAKYYDDGAMRPPMVSKNPTELGIRLAVNRTLGAGVPYGVMLVLRARTNDGLMIPDSRRKG